MSHKILIAPTTFCDFDLLPEKLLKNQGLKIVKNPYARKMTEGELLESASGCVGVIAGTEKYSKDVIEKLPDLKIISRVGVGMDNIDLEYAKRKNITVCCTTTTPTAAVAELALGLILDCLRKISVQNALLKSGKWEKTMGSMLGGKTLGIIGLGRIGRNLVKLTQGFNLKYMASDLYPDIQFAKENGIEICEIDTLLAASDVVSVHLNLTHPATSLIDYSKLKLMKPNAILINTSRGEVIHEPSLLRALKEKLIAGAALDVFDCEPYTGPLLELNNVIVTPHIGAYAQEVRIKMELESVENLLAVLGDPS